MSTSVLNKFPIIVETTLTTRCWRRCPPIDGCEAKNDHQCQVCHPTHYYVASLIVPGFRLCGKHKAAWAIFHSKPSSAKRNKDKFRRGNVVFGCNECGTQVGTVSFNLTFRIEQWLKYHCRMVIVYSRDVTTTGYTTIMPDDLGANVLARILHNLEFVVKQLSQQLCAVIFTKCRDPAPFVTSLSSHSIDTVLTRIMAMATQPANLTMRLRLGLWPSFVCAMSPKAEPDVLEPRFFLRMLIKAVGSELPYTKLPHQISTLSSSLSSTTCLTSLAVLKATLRGNVSSATKSFVPNPGSRWRSVHRI